MSESEKEATAAPPSSEEPVASSDLGLKGSQRYREGKRTADSYNATRGILERAAEAEKVLMRQIDAAADLASDENISESVFEVISKYRAELEMTQGELASLRNRVVELDKTMFAQIQRQDLSEVILSTVSDAIITIMDDGMIRDLNNAAATLLGCEAWAGLGEPISRFFAVPAIGAPSWLENFTELDGNPPTEADIAREDGFDVPIAFRVACTEIDGETISIITMHDLSQVKESAVKLEAMHKELVSASRQAGMAEIATGILHNVGNVLNSVTVSSELIEAAAKGKVGKKLDKLAGLLESNVDDLADFLAGGKGKKIIAYIKECANLANDEYNTLAKESSNMRENVDHIRRIIARQQEHAGGGMAIEQTSIEELITASYRIVKGAMPTTTRVITPNLYPDSPISIDTPRTVQIVTNLIKNAGQAIAQAGENEGVVTISCHIEDEKWFTVSVTDNGIGISGEQMKKMFGYGYTTKPDGHGFGLHDAINSARTMRGSLRCTSEGTDKGATFSLVLPLSPSSPKVELPKVAQESEAA